jgi:hypothetical protein
MWSFLLLQQRNKGTVVLLHPSVCHGTDFEQEQQLAKPDVVHPELKHAIRDHDAWQSDKHHVLVIGPTHLLCHKLQLE